MLTFTIYFLLKHPEALRKLREEIEREIGDRPMIAQDVNKLPYLTGKFSALTSCPAYISPTTHLLAVMRESLRLGPTAPMRGVTPLEDTVIGGGKYAVEKGTSVLVHVYATHRDPKVWGEDVRVPPAVA